MPAAFPHHHLLGIEGLAAADILAILDAAEPWIDFNRGARKADKRLAGLTQINAFFENSTRTLFSFEIAGKRLGAQVSSFHPAASSVRKGESLADTALTLNAMRPDMLVIRHEAEGAAADVAAIMDCPVINAGDGSGEHPTQALLDALTIRRRFGRIEGLKVAICGDIVHSRVAGSNMRSLPLLGAEVRLVGPESLLPAESALPRFTDLDEGIRGADVVMLLRIQRERMEEAFPDTLIDYHSRYGLTRAPGPPPACPWSAWGQGGTAGPPLGHPRAGGARRRGAHGLPRPADPGAARLNQKGRRYRPIRRPSEGTPRVL